MNGMQIKNFIEREYKAVFLLFLLITTGIFMNIAHNKDIKECKNHYETMLNDTSPQLLNPYMYCMENVCNQDPNWELPPIKPISLNISDI